MKQKITTKTFLWILGSTLLAFILFNAANYYFAFQSFTAVVSRANQVHTRNVAFSISSFYETVFRVIGEMAQAQEIKSPDASMQQRFIDERFSQYGFFDNLVVQRFPDGVQTARVRGEKAVRPERWWFRKIMEDRKPFVSHSFYSFGANAGMPTTAVSVIFPVVRDEKMVSLFAAFLRMDELQTRVGQHYLGEERYTYILDEKGVIVAHPEWEKVKQQYNYKTRTKALVVRDSTGKPLMDGQDYRVQYEPIEVAAGLQKIVQQVLGGESGTTEYRDLDGKIVLCSFQPVTMPGYGAAWAAITVQDKDLAMAPLQRAATRSAALSFAVLAGLAIMILRQSRELEAGTKKLAQSNAALETEICERVRAEADLRTANEDLVAMNEEMVSVADELQHTNQQRLAEIQVRHATEEKLRLRERQYRAMTQLIADNNAEFDVQMQSMLDSALELVNAADGHITLMENEKAIIRYARGSRIVLLGKELNPEAGLLPMVLATGKLQYIEDYQNFPGRRKGPTWDRQSTAVIFPLKQEEKVVGALSITWNDGIRSLSTDEIEMLQQFADLASLALQGAKLKESLRQELLQHEKLNEKVSHIAYHDSLTNLPNRAFLMEYLDREMEPATQGKKEGTIFFIDLDELKSINDNFGHLAGDRLIVTAGEKIRELAGTKAFVARLGGDEFIIVLPERMDEEEISRLGDRLVGSLCMEYQIGDKTSRVSASVGIAVYPRDGTTVEELMKKADNAMYAAKASGRNCWRFFDPVMLRDAQEKMLLTNGLRHALENNELQVVYQPQVELSSGGVVGFEALLRWYSKEHGIVPPARFIPLAEQSQLIVPIGMWVLRQACHFARHLSRSGYPQMHVAVNLSPKQLSDENLIGEVARLIDSAGIEPSQLEFEITESALLSSMEASSRKLKQLDELGVRLALDDFGTGYSSLTYLRLFPVKTLKIDKSFIDNIPERETVLVQSLIRFAQSLDMKVVAEGVERREQFEYLQNSGCDFVQGYYMSLPVSEEDAMQFLQAKGNRETQQDRS